MKTQDPWKGRLTSLAEQARPLPPAAVHRIMARARRRRLAQMSSASLLAVGVVIGIMFAVISVRPVAPQRTPADHPASPTQSPRSSTAPSGAKTSSSTAAREFGCGATLGPPLSTNSANGLSLTITHVSRASRTSPPRVQIRLQSTQHIQLVDDNQHDNRLPQDTGPRIVILHNGRIVAGQEMSVAGWVPAYLPFTPLIPGRPKTEQLTLTNEQVCTGTTWSQIWSNPSDYQLLATTSTLDPESWQKASTGDYRLIVARAPLTQ